MHMPSPLCRPEIVPENIALERAYWKEILFIWRKNNSQSGPARIITQRYFAT